MAMRIFCALTFHKIYDRLTRQLRLDTTLGPQERKILARATGVESPFPEKLK